MSAPIRIGIADDDEVIRLTLHKVLSRCPDVAVVATVPDGKSAVALAQSGTIEVLILDLEMPVMSGREALRLIRVLAPHVRVVMHSSRPAADHSREFLQAGATGYLQKPCDAQRLIDAIREAARAGIEQGTPRTI